MENLKDKINNLVEQSWEYEEEALLDYACSSLDWTSYYEHDIKKFFAENDIAEQDIERLLEDTFWWIDSCLVISHGIFSCSYEFSVASSQEIEIQLDGLDIFKTVPVSKRWIDWINRHTDLYIDDNGEYGYTSTDLLSVCIDANKVKDWLKENPPEEV